MQVNVVLSRNEAHPSGAAERTIGPFNWVQITYEFMRDDRDKTIAEHDLAGEYWITGDHQSWSDVTISPVDKS